MVVYLGRSGCCRSWRGLVEPAAALGSATRASACFRALAHLVLRGETDLVEALHVVPTDGGADRDPRVVLTLMGTRTRGAEESPTRLLGFKRDQNVMKKRHV